MRWAGEPLACHGEGVSTRRAALRRANGLAAKLVAEVGGASRPEEDRTCE